MDGDIGEDKGADGWIGREGEVQGVVSVRFKRCKG